MKKHANELTREGSVSACSASWNGFGFEYSCAGSYSNSAALDAAFMMIELSQPIKVKGEV